MILVSGSFTENSPVGIRFNFFQKFLERKFDLTIIHLSKNIWIFSRKNFMSKFIFRIYMKLPLFPDSHRLILGKYKHILKQTLKEKKIDYIIIQVLPFSFLLLAKFIKKISPETKVIFDFSDPITINVNFKNYPRLKQYRYSKLEKDSLAFADHLIVLNQEIKDYYTRFFEKDDKISVIEQGFEFLPYKREGNNFSRNCSIKTPIKLLYAGHFYKEIREPFELYNAISNSDLDVRLSVYGSFQPQFLPPKERRFFYGGRIPQDEVLKKYQEADVIIFIDNKNSHQVPGKTFEILSTNKPILCITDHTNSPSLAFLCKYKGIYYAENLSDKIQKAIYSIIKDDNFFWERDVDQYSWPLLLERLNRIIV